MNKNETNETRNKSPQIVVECVLRVITQADKEVVEEDPVKAEKKFNETMVGKILLPLEWLGTGLCYIAPGLRKKEEMVVPPIDLNDISEGESVCREVLSHFEYNDPHQSRIEEFVMKDKPDEEPDEEGNIPQEKIITRLGKQFTVPIPLGRPVTKIIKQIETALMGKVELKDRYEFNVSKK